MQERMRLEKSYVVQMGRGHKTMCGLNWGSQGPRSAPISYLGKKRRKNN